MILLTALACSGSAPAPSIGTTAVDPAPTPTSTSEQVETQVVPSCDAPVDMVVAVGPNSDTDFLLLSSMAVWFDLVLGSGLDARIGLLDATSTATSGVSWMDEDTVDPAGVLSVVKTYEQGDAALLERVQAALDGEGRSGGQLSIVGWLGADNVPSGALTDEEFATWLEGLGPDTASLWVAGPESVVAPLAAVADLTGGATGEAGYELFEDVAGLALPLTREFTLEQVPVQGTVEVEVLLGSGVVIRFDEDEDWAFDDVRNSIEFLEFVPACGDEVQVTYLPIE